MNLKIMVILLVGLSCLSMAARSQVTHGLTGYYIFNENAIDSSIYGNNGILIGNATAHGSLNIPRDDFSYLTLPNNILNRMNDFTVAFWVKFANFHTGLSNFNTILSGENEGKTGTDNITLSYRKAGVDPSGDWMMWLEYDYFLEYRDTINPGAWHFIAFMRQGSTAMIYKDGVLRKTATGVLSEALRIDPGGLIIGQEQDVTGGYFNADQCLDGNIAKLRFYYRALTAQEVALLYQDPTGITQNGFSQPCIIYPNPTAGQITFSVPLLTEPSSISLMNATGTIVFSKILPCNTTSFTADLSGNPDGLYLVRLETGNHTWFSRLLLHNCRF
jgi:hypothetical protein